MKAFAISHTACDLCGQNDTKLLFTGKDKLHKNPGYFKVVQCNQCGLVYTNPRPTEEAIEYFYPSDYDPHKEDNVNWQYIKVFSKQTKFLNKVKNDVKFMILSDKYGYPLNYALMYPKMKWFYSILKHMFLLYFKRIYYKIPHMIKDGRALDIGCGKGAYLLMLKELGWDVVGFDIAKIQSKYLYDHNIPVVIKRLDSTNLSSNSFDLVTFWHSLEHIHQPLKMLKEVHNLLKKGGFIYIEVPNNESFARYLFNENWFPWEIPRHLYHFSPRTLKKILLKAGFEEVKIYHICKKTILRSFFYWFDGRNAKWNIKSSMAANYLIQFMVKVSALLQRSEIVFATARKPF
jgi:SAM-dependent methyltransferase